MLDAGNRRDYAGHARPPLLGYSSRSQSYGRSDRNPGSS